MREVGDGRGGKKNDRTPNNHNSFFLKIWYAAIAIAVGYVFVLILIGLSTQAGKNPHHANLSIYLLPPPVVIP